MTEPATPNQDILLKHVVLSGLTPLVPIPVVDDLLRKYFERRCVRKLAAKYEITLSPEDIKILADRTEPGCLAGCLSVIVYPLKVLFRKIIFVFEWKRAIDVYSQNYHRWYLVNYALQQRWCAPVGPHSTQEIRRAIDAACRKTRTSPVEHAFRATLKQSQVTLTSAAKALYNRVKQLTAPTEEQVAQAAEAIQEQETGELVRVTADLQEALQNVPTEHFQKLCAQFAAELNAPQ